jgi:hypothetical protein
MIRQQVPLPILRIYGAAYCRIWDWRYQVRTCGDVQVEDLQVASTVRQQARGYVPTHPKLVRQLFDALPLQNGKFLLVDLGSGKGRVLVVGLSYPFARIEGVEVDPMMHGIAEANLLSYRGKRRCESARSLCINVCNYQFEPMDTVFFLFSPFRTQLMKLVLGRIFQSLKTHPRDVFIVFHNPEEHEKFIEESCLFIPFARAIASKIWRSRSHEP